MDAFFYANNTVQIFDSASTPGFRLVGELQLDAGSYVVIAKADIGTNVATGYPPPPWPYGGGVVVLAFGGAHDSAYAAIKPESGENIENLAVMVAAKSSSKGPARLYFLTPYSLRSVVNSVRIAALRVDSVNVVTVGDEVGPFPDEQAMVNFSLITGMTGMFESDLTRFLKKK